MLAEAPTVTVVIPCYNMGGVIGDAVESVLAQTFAAFEIIIVDDGSDDPGTISRLDEYAANGLILLRTMNCGVAAARNMGIQEARGKYILPLDADDLIEPHYLEKAVRLFEENPDISIVGCDAEMFGEVSGIRRLPEFSMERLLSENLLFVSAVYRKNDWQEVGGYCSAMKSGWEDWEFWIAMTKGHKKVVRIPEALLKYRISPDSRDRSMAMIHKVSMMLLIVARHYKCYLRSPMSFVRLIANSRPKFYERNP